MVNQTMIKNIGTADKWIRMVVGIGLLALTFVITSNWRWLGLIGVMPLGTALLNFCPIYMLIGINSVEGVIKNE
jgi:hypothetical protein